MPPVYAPARAVPLILRGAIWVTATLLAVALAGLAVQHYDPQLLADIHVVHHVGIRRIATVPGGSDPAAARRHTLRIRRWSR